MADVYEAFINEMVPLLGREKILRDEPMCRHTTFRVGGPADCLLYPAVGDELSRVLASLKKYDLPVTILGNGSNVLVRDKGIRGVVVVLGQPAAYIRHQGSQVIAGAGTSLTAVAQYAAQQGLSGLEFAAGIPGSLGGAVFMNAGAYGGEMMPVIHRVTALDGDGRSIQYEADELRFGYRYSMFQENRQIIAEMELSLAPGDPQHIQQQMKDFNERRRQKQPLEYPSAGSTFKRPEGYFAGTLIEQTGLKGFSVGGAQVSEKHAGFIINRGQATAADILALMAEVQQRVFDRHGVKLVPEVRVIGEE